MAHGTYCECGNVRDAGRPELFKLTYRPCMCESPRAGARPAPLGLLGTLMRGQAYRDKNRERLGLPDVRHDGGGILKGTFWGE